MKTKHIIITAFSVAAFTVGCKPTDDQAVVNDPSTSTRQYETTYDDVKKETKEAARAVNEYAYAQRVEFADKMRAEIAEMRVEMDRLGEKIDNSTGAAKEEAKQKLKALRERTDSLNKQLDSFSDTTESKWDDVKASFQKGYDEVKESFKDAREWLSEKIAP